MRQIKMQTKFYAGRGYVIKGCAFRSLMRRKLYKGAALIPGKYFNLKDVALRNHFRSITHRRLDLKAALLKPLCSVSPLHHSATFHGGKLLRALPLDPVGILF